jgi:hypothetical protein
MCKLKIILTYDEDSYVYRDSNQNKQMEMLLKTHNIIWWKCYILQNIAHIATHT